MMFLNRRQSEKGSDLPLLFFFFFFFLPRKALIDLRKHTDRSWYHASHCSHAYVYRNSPKNLREEASVTCFSHSNTNWSKKWQSLSEKCSFRDISKQARATSQISPWSLDKFLISDCVCAGHSGRNHNLHIRSRWQGTCLTPWRAITISTITNPERP